MLNQMKGLAFILLAFFCSNISYSQFNPGKLAVLVVGDGSAALSSSATAVFVKEFNISGGSQPGIIRASLPATATSGTSSINRAVTQSGTSTSEGCIGLSTDRNYLVVTGYNTTTGTASVASSVAATFPVNTRTVAKIDAAGTIDSKTTLNTTYSGVAIRSATTVNGTAYWTAGPNGICYIPDGNIAATTNLATTNTRVISNFNNQLYTTSGAGGVRLASVGSGLPTSGTPAITNLNGYPTNTGDPYSYVFIDLNGGGPDIVYVASLSSAPSGLLKYTSANNGSTWVAQGSLLGNIFGVTGFYNACTGNVDLYITANSVNAKPNSLYKFSDLSVSVASPGSITSNGSSLSTVGTLLATAAVNTAFGGVSFTPGTIFTEATVYNVTGGNSCFGTSVIIGLSNSEKGFSYQLYNGANPVGASVEGFASGAAISFGSQSAAGTYTVVATNTLTGCTTNMNGNANIYALPTVNISNLDTNYCPHQAPVTLSATPSGGTFSGPGISGNIFSPAAAGVGGPYTITYSYTDPATGCSNSFVKQVSVNAVPTVSISALADTICAGFATSINLSFTGAGPWKYAINYGPVTETSANPEVIPVNPAITTLYEVTSLSDANCNGTEWVGVSAGTSHVLAIKSDGSLWSWGFNGSRQLGIGNMTDTNRAVRVGNENNWAKVSAGAAHSLALKTDGTLWAWGNNGSGRLGVGTASGLFNTPQQVGSANDWVKIDAGTLSSVALKSDGTLWGWGSNADGILGDGTVVQRNSPVQVGTDTDWTECSIGASHTLALKSNGTLWGWGSGSVGQLGGATPGYTPHQMGVLTDWDKIIAGNENSMAIKANGTLWGWGRNLQGELGNGNNLQTNNPTKVGSASDWQQVSFTSIHSHGIKQDGTLWSWGSNQSGSFGTGNSSSSNIPVQAGIETNWTMVSSGLRFGAGIRSDNTLWTWGINNNGQLGAGSFSDTLSPVQVQSSISSVTINVYPLPVVGFDGLSSDYCENSLPVTLTGTPSYGFFNGTGISGNSFNPAVAGAGMHSITYSYTNSNGCTNSISQTIKVHALPETPVISGNLCSGSTLTISPANGIESIVWNLNGSPVLSAYSTSSVVGSIAVGAEYGLGTNILYFPSDVAFGENGDIYVAEQYHNRINKWIPGDTIGVTVAGGYTAGSAPDQLNTPTSVTLDGAGNIYIADKENDRIQKWAPGASNGTSVGGGFFVPHGVAVDGSGNIYVSEQATHRVQKWTPGTMSFITVAGGNGAGSAADQLYSPRGIAVDRAGNIYIADRLNHRIQKWAPGATSGITVAGGNGLGSQNNQLSYPSDVSLDGTGNIYVADEENHRIQKWFPGANSGITVAGGTGPFSTINALNYPKGVTVDFQGNIFIADFSNHRIQHWRQATADTSLRDVIAGTYTVIVTGFSGCSSSSAPVVVNQTPEVSFIGLPETICGVSSPLLTLTGSPAGGTFTGPIINGNIFDPLATGVGDHVVTYSYTAGNGCSNNSIKTVSLYDLPDTPVIAGNICAGSTLSISPATGIESLVWNLNGVPLSTSVARGDTIGILGAGGNGQGPGTNQFNFSYGLTIDGAGNIYIADEYNHRIQKWVPGATSGITVAGGNGAGSAANQLFLPYDVAIDASGNIFVSDRNNHRIQKWSPGATSGITVAGGNGAGITSDKLDNPKGIVLDRAGNIYIADQGNHRIQKWAHGAASGITVAGGNEIGSSSNQLFYPNDVAVDSFGNVYVADLSNYRIQKWAPGATSGNTVAGGNGQGSAANQLSSPYGVELDGTGNLYIADAGNSRVQKWMPGATSGITVAGGNGQGSALNQMNFPAGIEVDRNGNIYVVEVNNFRVLKWGQTLDSIMSYAAAGNYNVTVTGFTGCSASSNSFTVVPLPEITFSGLPPTYCSNGTALTLTGSPTGGTFSGPGINGNIFDPALAGTGGPYTITYSYTDPETGCSNTTSQQVTVFGLPALSVTASHTQVCSGSPVTLTASGASTYVWMPGGLTGSSITVNPASTTMYTVTGTDANGCSTTPGWVDVSGGLYHSLGIKSDGTLWAWGDNSVGQLGIGTFVNKIIPVQIGTATSWKKVSGGGSFSAGIKSDGTLWAWGENFAGQLGDGTNTDKNLPVQIGAATDWKEISAGDYHCLAIKTDGTLWAWGDNSKGQLGDGTNMTKYVPVQIGSATNWSKVSSGQLHSISIKSDGTLWSWGSNEFGQLGDGTLSDKSIPVQIGSATDWANISAGASHNTGIKTNGTLWAWGWNYYGQLGDGTNTDSHVPLQVGVSTDWKTISGGANESVALKANGTLWAWGNNIVGQLGNGTNTDSNIPVQAGVDTNWNIISSGYAHSLGIKTDGNLWAWGDNGFGQLGDGTTNLSNLPQPIGSSSVSITITVNPLPVVSFTGLAGTYCLTDAAVILAGTPAGGTFSGPGVSGNVFDPAAAGAGTHSIVYTFTDANGCTNSETQQVTVNTCAPSYTTLNLTIFLEGFYYDINTMRANIYDLGISSDPAETDTITVNLWSPSSLSNTEPDHTVKAVLHTDGTASMQFPASATGNAYYIAIRHRNHMETWSKLPVMFSSSTDYDFTDNLQKAFDDGVNPPMAAVAGGKYAIYGGDVNQDGTVDASDMADVDNDNAGFAFGYNLTDVNGDGATDASDISIIDNNQALFLFYARPY